MIQKFALKNNTHNDAYLKTIEESILKNLEESIPSLPFSAFKLYAETGSRVEYEKLYFNHRRLLTALAILVMSGKEQYVNKLEDIISAVLDEYTWVLPAHLWEHHDTAEKQIESIDLCASETAFTLSEIYYNIGDKLTPLLCSRIEYELNRRIIKPYREHKYKWDASNWSAVCISGIIAAYVYLNISDTDELIPDFCNSLDTFLSSYSEDGCCLEGMLYWSYGFGCFTFAADLLRQYTDGRIDYFKNEKVKKAAAFGSLAYLNKNIIVPYSDSPDRHNYNIGLMHFLKKEYSSDFELLPEEFEATYADVDCCKYHNVSRNMFWYDENLKSSPTNKKCIDFPISQWYIRNNKEYVFSCKGGNNKEPHNHNDVGSFCILKDEQFIVDDFGYPVYDKNYFKPEHRYKDYICAMSEGHNLPIINGKGQEFGVEYKAEVISVSENKIVMDVSKAYPIEDLQFVRSFELFENSVVISDDLKCVCPVTERFVTRIKPIIKDNKVIIGDSTIACDKTSKINILTDHYNAKDKSRTGLKKETEVYLIDFCFEKGGVFNFNITI